MILAFEIGASRIRSARDGGALGEVAPPLADFAAFVAALRGFVMGGERGVAISIAGVVDSATGRNTVANIRCLDGRPVAAEVRAALDLAVRRRMDAVLGVQGHVSTDAGLIGATAAGEVAFAA